MVVIDVLCVCVFWCPQVQQNVHDVSYHVTQYHTLIAELKKKIAQLQERLAHCKCTPAAYGEYSIAGGSHSWSSKNYALLFSIFFIFCVGFNVHN